VKIQEIAEAIRAMSEDSIKKLKIESWLSLELGRIVNRRTYWWRKAALEFSTVANAPTYDLAGGTPIAADFLQMASPLYQFDGTTKVAELPFVSDALGMLQMRRSSTGGTPTLFTVELGTSKTLRLAPIPNAVYNYAGVYYRGAVIKWTSPNDDEVPLIPPEFHYVLYQAMERRAFFYLYGQKDPRAVLAAQAEAQCIADLDSYKAPSTLVAPEWRSGNPQDFVQSTH
jgi:hypothetical protein